MEGETFGGERDGRLDWSEALGVLEGETCDLDELREFPDEEDEDDRGEGETLGERLDERDEDGEAERGGDDEHEVRGAGLTDRKGDGVLGALLLCLDVD